MVEEPNKTINRDSPSQLGIKVLAGLLAVALIASVAMFIDSNNKKLELADRYHAFGTEISRLQTTLNSTQASLKSLNATLTSLERFPLVKAANMIILEVELDYFNEYFHDPTIDVHHWDGINVTKVTYKYRIEVNDYVADRDVSFYFHPNFVMSYGVPKKPNLQPFNLTREEAIRLALDAGLPSSRYDLEASIYWDSNTDVLPLSPYADKYIWKITSWNDPPWAKVRTERHAVVDPNTGQVYTTSGSGGTSLIESQVDTAEEALSHGVNGYIKLDYPELLQQITLTEEGNLTFTIRVTFTSYKTGLQEVNLTVDSYYVDPYEIQWNLRDKLRDYVSYEPHGVVTLRAGESINVTATVRVPDGGEGFTFNRWGLSGLGVGAEGVLILSDLEV